MLEAEVFIYILSPQSPQQANTPGFPISSASAFQDAGRLIEHSGSLRSNEDKNNPYPDWTYYLTLEMRTTRQEALEP